MREKIGLALQPAVVRRALGYAVVVGSLLVAINHGDAILAGSVDAERWLRMGLTVMVPYVVSTLSSVGAMRAGPR
ncbi:MAG: nitrate/nitrite transporter NrtS [Myxococcota bacterium]